MPIKTETIDELSKDNCKGVRFFIFIMDSTLGN